MSNIPLLLSFLLLFNFTTILFSGNMPLEEDVHYNSYSVKRSLYSIVNNSSHLKLAAIALYGLAVAAAAQEYAENYMETVTTEGYSSFLDSTGTLDFNNYFSYLMAMTESTDTRWFLTAITSRPEWLGW